MKTKPHVLFFFILIITLLTACAAPAATPTTTLPPTEEPKATRVIVLGDISDDPAEVINGTQPLADYLAAKLAEQGITGGEVKIASSTDEMIQMLAAGEVDLYFDSVYPATLISDASGGQIVLRRWRYGVEQYNSVIFASKESGIQSLDDLKGHMVAMDAPYSTSGFMLPAVTLTEHGLKLVGKKSYDEPVASNEVGFVFSYDDENTLQWVLSGLVSAGVTDDYHFDVAFPADVTGNLVDLGRTEYTPRQVMVARPGLDPELLQAIVQILTTMHEDEAGQTALEPFQTTRFDEFPDGLEAARTRIHEMMDIVKDIPLP